jgi:hypothetical protein
METHNLHICFNFTFLPKKLTETISMNLESAKNSALFDVSHGFRRKKLFCGYTYKQQRDSTDNLQSFGT